jgi:hypothetical protein
VKVEEPVTVRRKLAVAVAPVESVTTRENRNVPVAVGVPEMVALGLPEVNARPAGSVEEAARVQV